MKQYDVVIAGGAMAGATLAIALNTLSNGQLKIAVVEAVAPKLDQHPGYDARSIALSLGSANILRGYRYLAADGGSGYTDFTYSCF